MLIHFIVMIWQLSVVVSGAAEPACIELRGLFDSSNLSLLERLHKEAQEVEKESVGIPAKEIEMSLTPTVQLRYYEENPIFEGQGPQRVLKLEKLYDVGIYDSQDLHYVKLAYARMPLKISRLLGYWKVEKWVPVRTIEIDPLTGLITTNSKDARGIVEHIVQERVKSGKSALFFLDLDNLGVVNYLGGHGTMGDKYIQDVLKAVFSSLRRQREGNHDLGFRLQNGDEFLIVLDNVKQSDLDLIKERIYQAVKEDVALQQLRDSAYTAYQHYLKRLKGLDRKSLDVYPSLFKFIKASDLWQSLTVEQKAEVLNNDISFRSFIEMFVDSQEMKLRGEHILHLQLGTSIGTVMISPDYTYKQHLNIADQRMQDDKIARKSEHNQSLPVELRNVEKEDIFYPDFQ